MNVEYLLAFVVILSVMMFVHELGHFITARLAGITVQEFGFGLPPRLFGFKRNGVIYSINLIPFGAFVKMLGEEDPTAPGSFASKPLGIRAIVLAAGSAMNFFLAVLAFSMVYMVGVPRLTIEGPVELAAIAPESPAAAAGLQPGDVVTGVAGQPTSVGVFRDLTQQNLDRPDAARRAPRRAAAPGHRHAAFEPTREPGRDRRRAGCQRNRPHAAASGAGSGLRADRQGDRRNAHDPEAADRRRHPARPTRGSSGCPTWRD